MVVLFMYKYTWESEFRELKDLQHIVLLRFIFFALLLSEPLIFLIKWFRWMYTRKSVILAELEFLELKIWENWTHVSRICMSVHGSARLTRTFLVKKERSKEKDTQKKRSTHRAIDFHGDIVQRLANLIFCFGTLGLAGSCKRHTVVSFLQTRTSGAGCLRPLVTSLK